MVKQPLVLSTLLLALLISAGCASSGPAAGVQALQLLSRDQSRPAMRRLLSLNPNERLYSLTHLARVGDPTTTPLITPFLNREIEPSPFVRATAAVALRILGDDRAIPAIVKASNDPYPIVRIDVARTLGTLGGRQAEDELLKMLQEDFSNDVRLEAAHALGRIGDKASVKPLINALDDPDTSVAFASHRALTMITSQDIPPLRRAWELWFKTTTPQ